MRSLFLLAVLAWMPLAAVESAAQQQTVPTCAPAVHASYRVPGPDGLLYDSWHPQIDVSGCAFHHEHGTDPSLFAGYPAYRPLFGYVGSKAGMNEAHAGFKVHGWAESGREWLYVLHQGTSGQARACVRFHSIELAVADATTGELLAVLRMMGDFGEAKINRTGTKIPAGSCEGVAGHVHEHDASGFETAGGTGERSLPSLEADNIGYEPWRVDLEPNALGLTDGDLSVNAASSVAACTTNACASVTVVGDWANRHGAMRHMLYQDTTQQKLSIVDLGHGGTFTTNPEGTVVGGTVAQYVKPGLTITADSLGRMYPNDAQTFWYTPSEDLLFGRSALNHQLQLRSPN